MGVITHKLLLALKTVMLNFIDFDLSPLQAIFILILNTSQKNLSTNMTSRSRILANLNSNIDVKAVTHPSHKARVIVQFKTSPS